MSLPEERVPFPVEPRYSVRPTMRRWGPDDRGHLRLDKHYPEYLDAKLRLLASDAGGCRVLAPDVDRTALRRTLLRVAENLALETPTPILVEAGALRFPLLGIALGGPGLDLVDDAPAEPAPAEPADVPSALRGRAREHLAGLEPLERLADALALAVQEDLVVMAGGGSGDRDPGDRDPGDLDPDDLDPGERNPDDGRSELLHVCFPSSWDPAARAGAGFVALHAPVPHSDTLRSAAGRVVRAMVSKGPFVRYVWSLAPDGALDRNPRRIGTQPPPDQPPPDLHAPDPARLWFRVERQTVMPLPASGRALFTIRVYRAPLPSVLTTPERRRTLASALRSMDAALLAYKGVGGLREALLAYLDDPAAA